MTRYTHIAPGPPFEWLSGIVNSSVLWENTDGLSARKGFQEPGVVPRRFFLGGADVRDEPVRR